MRMKLTISAVVTLCISNLAATPSDAMIYSSGMGKPGLELRHATTTFEPVRMGRVGSRATRGVPRHHSGTSRQGTSPTQQQRQGTSH
jgi:hypothetical protein